MEISKLVTLLCCAAVCFASHYSHTIPVEGYETELENLGEHVEIPETPVKVVKITKTVAVKVPVPYPVKVVEKVPYPVHVNRPYPVPVPQFIKVPHAVAPKANHEKEALDVDHGGQFNANAYQVQEDPRGNSDTVESYNSSDDGGHQGNDYAAGEGDYESGASPAGYYGSPQNYQGAGDQDGHNSFQSKNYNLAIQNYLNNLNSNANNGFNGYH